MPLPKGSRLIAAFGKRAKGPEGQDLVPRRRRHGLIRNPVQHQEAQQSAPSKHEPLDDFQEQIRLLEQPFEPLETSRGQITSLEPLFRHEPLEDSRRQIRLLRLRAGGNDDDLELDLTTWNLEEAPEYYAISYAWGHDETTSSVSLNGCSHRVRKNCHYALWQCRLHYAEAFLWMDSICIYQNDSSEKGHQVSLMQEIYVRASWVLACIGAHERCTRDAIQFAGEALQAGQKTFTAMGDTDSPAKSEAWWQDIFASRTKAQLSDIQQALLDFQKRPYFSRLWVQQEIAAADKNVQFLCGNETFSWDIFEALVDLVSPISCSLFGRTLIRAFVPGWPLKKYDDEDEAYLATYSLATSGLNSGSLDRALQRTSSCGYTVPHDRLFAILPLVKWSNGETPIIIDYKKSLLSLVCEAATYLTNYSVVSSLLRELRLDCHHPDVKHLQENRYHLKHQQEGHDDQPLASHILRLALPRVRWIRLQTHQLSDLPTDDFSTNLKYPFFWEGVDGVFAKGFLAAQGRAREERPKLFSMKLSSASVDPEYFAFVCGATVANDIMVDPGFNDGCFLVLREAAGAYDVVGQGFFFYFFAGWEKALGRLELKLTTEDFVLLIAQDRIAAGDRNYDMQARIERLFVNPFSKSKGAANFIEDADGSIF